MKKKYKIAITGRIGSGKSTLSKILIDLGYSVFESDNVVNKILNQKDLINEVEINFSSKIKGLIMKNGKINKESLSNFVFSRKLELKKLENLIYPKLHKKKEDFIKKNSRNIYLFFDVPLLFEKKLQVHYDFIIYLFAKKHLRYRRVVSREGMTQEKFKKISKNQQSNISKYRKFISLKIDMSEDLKTVKRKLQGFMNDIS